MTGAPLGAADPQGPNAGVVVGLIVGLTAGTIALGGAAWYVRRRWLR